jgi:uncharacterized protein
VPEAAWSEVPLTFELDGATLIGITTRPSNAVATGVLIIVGGPQYRAGSHRQFTLVARALGAAGYASFRFDYRGMGDSEGEIRNFEHIDGDIRAAIDAFLKSAPEVRTVVLWGLCDAASAAMYYAWTDPRVTGLILLNPWVHTLVGAARARLRNYYLDRLLDRKFWTKLVGGKLRLTESIKGVVGSAREVMGASEQDESQRSSRDPRHGSPGYIDRMLNGLVKFSGPIQLILSEKDLTAQEFLALSVNHTGWRKVLNRAGVTQAVIEHANHTFSSHEWRLRVTSLNIAWLAASCAKPISHTLTADKT